MVHKAPRVRQKKWRNQARAFRTSPPVNVPHLTSSRPEDRKDMVAVEGLGWFSLGLGAAQLLFPNALARWIGVQESPTFLRACGLREIACGLGLLFGRRKSPWLWARVVGDAMDLAVLSAASPSRNADPVRNAVAIAAVAGVTAADVVYSVRRPEGTTVLTTRTSITLNVSPEKAYQFWRDLENLPRFLRHLESVRPLDERRSHWVAVGPAGTTFEWDAEITADEPNRVIAWRSLENADLRSVGKVEFEPGPEGRGTVVRLEMEYMPPAGAIGSAIASLLDREPAQQLQDDLRRCKQLLEVGEIITTEGQPAGRSQPLSWRFDSTAVAERNPDRIQTQEKRKSDESQLLVWQEEGGRS